MATTTTRLGLRKPAGSDSVNVSTDLDANFDAIDTVIGSVYATKSTRPSTPFQGESVYESDTGASIVHNGSSPASAGWVYPRAVAGYLTAATRPSVVSSGLLVRESDTHNLVVSNGSSPASGSWEHVSVPVVSSTSAIVAPYTNQLVIQSSDNVQYRYNGSSWDPVNIFGVAQGYAYYKTTGTGLTTISTGTVASYTFDTAVSTCADVTASGTNNNKFTFNRGGVWMINACMECKHTGTPTGLDFSLAITLNGATFLVQYFQKPVIASNVFYSMEVSKTRRFSAGDYITIDNQNNCGTSITEVNSAEMSSVSFTWLRP